eukprot:m.393749 g.393749  ORF g.393749 m.393749 type:complete len:102 (+) comp28333_c0_seq2:585-890(+)
MASAEAVILAVDTDSLELVSVSVVPIPFTLFLMNQCYVCPLCPSSERERPTACLTGACPACNLAGDSLPTHCFQRLQSSSVCTACGWQQCGRVCFPWRRAL